MAAFKFLFDYGSPASYLAWKRLPAMVARTGASVEVVPILLGGVFKATGNVMPASVPAKGRWMNGDLAIWAKRDGTPLTMNPHFPINTVALMRGAVAAEMRGELTAYSDAVFNAMWRDGRNTGDLAVLADVLTEAGLDAAAYAAAIDSAEVKDKLRANTEAAVAAGAFGAPSFLVGDRLFFGQDRTAFVELALKGEL
ncbi:2-hydroxychromene-2-carboxylate isomerase [Sandaracinobacteroides hominis]|uniref:2-hydroxychromene-2-carboxylate isomerase n=1 Tax=Sandaracinobacteroides hominis TaxID=2780086 RepID=UPI0018F4A744|nr:2-hydroxychromene-2-carboxylate isomerase [Sandaracinobacteroides hominis]